MPAHLSKFQNQCVADTISMITSSRCHYNIGTAYLRIALLPEAARGPLQDKFREYLDSRLLTYRPGTDVVRVSQLLQQTAQQESDLEIGAGSDRPRLESTGSGADSAVVE
jgi:hypothetical protein